MIILSLCKRSQGNRYQWTSQEAYEAVGRALLRYLQELMVAEFHLERILLPVDARAEPTICIFASPCFRTAENLMLFIANPEDRIGCALINNFCLLIFRPGQWCRAVCINDSFKNGSVLDFARRAVAMDFKFVILNANEKARGSSTPELLFFCVFFVN